MNKYFLIEEPEEFLYIINGVISEVMPPVAYRRMGPPKPAERKPIKCPYCKAMLTSVERNTLVQLYRIPKGKRREAMQGQIFKKCSICKGEVGIIMN
jgi:hypothetical protein